MNTPYRRTVSPIMLVREWTDAQPQTPGATTCSSCDHFAPDGNPPDAGFCLAYRRRMSTWHYVKCDRCTRR